MLIVSFCRLGFALPADCSNENVKSSAEKFNMSEENLNNLLSNTVVTVRANKRMLFSKADKHLTQGDCSGFFIHDRLHVATALHCVVGSDGADIVLRDGSVIPAKNISNKNSAFDIIILELEDHNHQNIVPIQQVKLQTQVELNEEIMIVPGCQSNLGIDNPQESYVVGRVDRLDGANALKSPAFLTNEASAPKSGKSGALVMNQSLEVLGLLSSNHFSQLPLFWSDQAQQQQKQYYQGGVSSVENFPTDLSEYIYDKSFSEFFAEIVNNQDPYASFFLAAVLRDYPNVYDYIRALYKQAEGIAHQNNEAHIFHWIGRYAYYDLMHAESARHYFNLANDIQKDAHTLFHLAMIEHVQRNYGLAKSYIEQAIELTPEHGPAQYYLSRYR